MTKRKQRKKNNRRKKSTKQVLNFRLINIILVIIIALILVLGYIIYIADTKKYKEIKQTTSKQIKKTIKQELPKVERKAKEEFDKYIDEIKVKKDQFEEYTKDLYEEYVEKDKIINEKKVEQESIKEKKEELKKSIEVVDTPKATKTKKPKLAIIFDDVTTQSQVNQINNIGYKTTISVMPPTSTHPDSAKITKNLPFYMIHFPLEATYFKNEEKHTLHIGDSYEKIEKRVAQIRQWYPNAKYTNNHTGSKFTADEESMDKLFKALVKYKFIFMDSRTTGKTVARKMAEKYNMPYIGRNIFLDNEQEFDYIQNQLKKAVRIAKRNGYAIAICHPHSATIKTLSKSKELLKDVELIYLNQLSFLD